MNLILSELVTGFGLVPMKFQTKNFTNSEVDAAAGKEREFPGQSGGELAAENSSSRVLFEVRRLFLF